MMAPMIARMARVGRMKPPRRSLASFVPATVCICDARLSGAADWATAALPLAPSIETAATAASMDVRISVSPFVPEPEWQVPEEKPTCGDPQWGRGEEKAGQGASNLLQVGAGRQPLQEARDERRAKGRRAGTAAVPLPRAARDRDRATGQVRAQGGLGRGEGGDHRRRLHRRDRRGPGLVSGPRLAGAAP